MLSIIIPSRNEKYLNKTLEDLLSKAKGAIEIIIVLDGYWQVPIITDDRIIYIHKGLARGMRAAINSAVAIAKGKYIMKTDAHCMFDEGYDEVLKADCEKNWVVVPRRKRLDPETWSLKDVNKPDVDYMFLCSPTNPEDFGGAGLNGKIWDEKNKDPELKKILIDDLMSAQGSCWFMHRDYFYELELMDEESYGIFWNEFQEIGLKCWLSGGRVVVNKKTWYAHWHKGKENGRGYFLSRAPLEKGANYTRKWLTMGEAWHKQTLPIEWLIKKFSPVPTWEQNNES